MRDIIDFHTHILPGIDDGSSSLEESVSLLRMEAEQGIGKVLLTPHFYPRYDDPEEFLQRRETAEQILREEMLRLTGLPQIEIGAEVHFFPGISESEVLSQLTIGSKRCILLEMPQSPWTESMYRELAGISQKQGITPVIAHVDRYVHPLRTFGIPERLEELPVLVQANASFFLRRSTARMALRMLKKDQIHLLGSDCHNLTVRMPNLGEALSCIEKKLGDDFLRKIAEYQQEVL